MLHPSNGDTPQPEPEHFQPDVVLSDEGVRFPALNLRALALAEGTLIDVSEMAKETGFLYPVAVTAVVWADIQAIPAAYSHEDADSRLWDVLWMARLAIQQAGRDGSELHYRLILHVGETSAYEVKLTVGPGDNREPAITLSHLEKEVFLALGALHITNGALDAFAEENASPIPYLLRHQRGDWGNELDDQDTAANNRAAREGERVLSAYTLPQTGEKIWIITEWDRSVTTVMRPSEY